MRGIPTRRRVAGLLAAAALLAAASPSAAQTGPVEALEVVVGGGPPKRFTPDDLANLPAAEVEVPAPEGHGSGRTRYAGVPLWTVLEGSGLDGMRTHDRMRRVVTVTGRDGYAAVLALAEIDPAFEGKPVLVALSADGRPIGPGALRLVVPGDKRGGRGVRDVARVRVD